MKLLKSEIKYIIEIIFTFTFLNVAFNIFGLWFSKLLNETAYTYLDSITNQFTKPIVIQSVLFAICFSAAYLFMKNKKLARYAFVVFQIVVFHIIFLLNLKIHHGLHFVTTFDNPGLSYLSTSGQYLVDILYLYFPINGNFENNMFMPDHLGTFYLHWIFLNLVYYFALTWITIQTTKFFFENKPETPKNKVEIETKEL